MQRSFLVLALLACLGWALVTVTRWGMADYYADVAYKEMDAWSSTSPVTEQSWQSALKSLREAERLDPTHPVYQQRLSRLHRIRITELLGSAQFHDDSELALSHLEQSIEYRPYWAAAWAEYAYLKWLLREKDEAYYHALDKALMLGPWEPTVIRLVNHIGLADFSSLDAARQQLVLSSLVRGLRSPVNQLFDDTLEQLGGALALKRRLVFSMYPFLVTTSWPIAVRFNFFQLVEWFWPVLKDSEKLAMLGRSLEVLKVLTPPYSWLSRIRDANFKSTLCDAIVQEIEVEKEKLGEDEMKKPDVCS